jgi:hypothetical protein
MESISKSIMSIVVVKKQFFEMESHQLPFIAMEDDSKPDLQDLKLLRKFHFLLFDRPQANDMIRFILA